MKVPPIIAAETSPAKYLIFTLPINMRISEVTNSTAAVEKLAGKISAQTMTTGQTI